MERKLIIDFGFLYIENWFDVKILVILRYKCIEIFNFLYVLSINYRKDFRCMYLVILIMCFFVL